MSNAINSFLGTGWSFPPTFSKSINGVETVSELKDIEQSLKILLGTTPGERLMHPKFGCNLKKFVFEKIDSSLITEMNDFIEQAILNFEPRVKFISAEVLEKDEMDGILSINVYYKVIITNTRHNIVFPFYKLEGTNLPNNLLMGND